MTTEGTQIEVAGASEVKYHHHNNNNNEWIRVDKALAQPSPLPPDDAHVSYTNMAAPPKMDPIPATIMSRLLGFHQGLYTRDQDSIHIG